MTNYLKVGGAVTMEALERELGTPEGFARRIVLDRDLPRVGILLVVLGLIGLVVTATGVVEELGEGWPFESYLDPSGAGWFWVGLPALLFVLGIVLWLRARFTRARLADELHANRIRCKKPSGALGRVIRV